MSGCCEYCGLTYCNTSSDLKRCRSCESKILYAEENQYKRAYERYNIYTWQRSEIVKTETVTNRDEIYVIIGETESDYVIRLEHDNIRQLKSKDMVELIE